MNNASLFANTKGLSLDKTEGGISGNKQNVEFLTNEQTLEILRILMLGVTPAISIFGIVGNVFSILVLYRHGLRKCSNILLISLAFNDIAFLIGFNSVPKLLYEVSGQVEGFRYDENSAYVLYIFHHVFHNMDYASGGASLTLPMLITCERLVAVFLPLRFHRLVTPTRTWCSVTAVILFWYIYFLHTSLYADFSYEYSAVLNRTVGLITRSSYHYHNLQTVAILEETMSYLMMKIPPAVTLIGCIAIGVKVKLASSRRKKLVSASGGGSGESTSRRTTKMLLAVCAVYTITCGILSLPTFIPQYVTYTITSDAPSNLGKVMYQIINVIVCVNSSYNFVIYVVMNKNFRDTYTSLFSECTCAKHTRKQGAHKNCL